MVERLFLTVPWGCLQFVIVVFPDHTHLLFLVSIVTPIVGFCNCSMFCYALLCVHSSFVIISIGKRELVALLWFVFLASPNCCVALPLDATGLSVVCDCDIS